MITIHFVSADADLPTSTKTIRCKTGQSLMEAAVDARVDGIDAECGGMLSCGTCHVYVLDAPAGALAAPADDELDMLGFIAAPRRPESRLSCQIPLTAALDGMTVQVPDCQH